MTITSRHGVPEPMKTSIIRIFSYADKNPTGTFYNPYYGVTIPFGNLTRLLLLMEDMMNELGCPQSTARSRSFTATPKAPEQVSLPMQPAAEQNVLATFSVKVLFRQSASWQGKVTWLEGEKEVAFRSALELIQLLDSALPQPEVCNTAEDRAADDDGYAQSV